MKFCLLISVLYLCFFVKSNGQQNRFFVGVHVGPAFPLGKFATEKENNEDAGRAEPGISLNLHATYQLSQTFGITLLAGGQENKKSLSSLKRS